jgi:hypothetical protein
MHKQKLRSVPGVLIRGSLITLKRKCGKPTCSCAEGDPHTTPALSYSVKGKTHILTLRNSDVPTIRQALNNYKVAAAELEKRAITGIRHIALNIINAKRRG